jgi:hypothetical protein
VASLFNKSTPKILTIAGILFFASLTKKVEILVIKPFNHSFIGKRNNKTKEALLLSDVNKN